MADKIYSLDKLTSFLLTNPNLVRIAFQYNKENLKYSSEISNYLRKVLPEEPKRFYFYLGESSYGDCCVDKVTALHLNPDIIIRVGSSCMTNPSELNVFYLPENRQLKDETLHKVLDKIKTDSSNCLYSRVFFQYSIEYDRCIKEFFEKNLSLIQKDFNLFIPQEINSTPKKDSFPLFNRFFVNLNSENENLDQINDDKLTKKDVIYVLTEENNFVSEAFSYNIVMQMSNVTNITSMCINDETTETEIKQFDNIFINKLFMKRFNLSMKAKESETFGILIGNLNIKYLNNILQKIKKLLVKNNKKYYTFLLGKITDEKLSNYVEYIDSFVLVACTCNSFVERKALMKPIVTPVDLLHAFEEKTWDLSYSYDPYYFNFYNKTSSNEKNEENKEDKFSIQDISKKIQSDALVLLDKDENKALSLVFSNNIMTHYDQRTFKGLEVNKGEEYSKEIKKGKKGLPIKYEDL